MVSIPYGEVATFLALFFGLVVYVRGRRHGRLPGPSGFPIIGNLLDMTALDDPASIKQWGRKYGELTYLRVFRTPFVFINGAKAVTELLDKRSALYSDRPYLPLAGGIIGLDKLVPNTPFGERFRLERKLMGTVLNIRAVNKWEHIISKETHLLLQQLLETPDQFSEHIRRMSTALYFMTLYGYPVQGDYDPFVLLAEEFMAASSVAIRGGWLVDFIPALRYIPFLSFHRKAAAWRAKVVDWVDKPYAELRKYFESNRDCLCGAMLNPEDGPRADAKIEEHIKWIATSVYGPGSDSSAVAIKQFILALTINPDICRRAGEELDAVVGRGRLPTLADRDRLPYIEAVYREVLRWGTPIPLSVPHRLIQDDVYEGKVIPKGSWCLANIWGILHDEELYPDPFSFHPERFMQTTDAVHARLIDPETYVFGFGRRRCPGHNFAHASVWLAVACILACFEVAPIGDKEEDVPKPAFTSGAIRTPLPFACKITPRHPKVAEIIEQNTERAQE
ncbi:cytochrome P450 [Punctularia strigosozonata HHB-11173 SS5]|uniref:cytochrome P450 n=1 Tax=Punctularia strigosozonata (strain HHB-11173) TaxID=741275 RepID=UPI0004416FD6|nr:cytochrome P450 [Punctularia strigosozonata HHB-11173 SS5]EIN11184.1 cytochrome P450 [Punctularia strigosozonata HHB-11173 SS5]